MHDYDELLVAIRRMTRAIDLHSKALLKSTGLTTSQLLVLEAVAQDQLATPSQIARDVHLSQATVTNLVDRLTKNGLVQREKSAVDRRAVNIVLTESGKEKLENAPELLQSGFLSKFRQLATWEQHLLISAMQRIATMMDAEDIDASPILTTGEIYPVKQPAE